MWLLANGTLVFPVILSLLVLYVAYKGVADNQEQLNGLVKDVRERESGLLKLGGERIAQLEGSQTKLIELLSSCCCPAKGTVHRPRRPCEQTAAQTPLAGDAPQAARP